VMFKVFADSSGILATSFEKTGPSRSSTAFISFTCYGAIISKASGRRYGVFTP
jgi:hypothetical protein